MSIQSLPAPTLQRRWMVLGAAILLAVIAINYFFKITTDERSTRSAIQRWQSQLQAMDDGENIWAKHIYPNPPIMALILEPLSELPSVVGAMTWFVLKALMTMLAIYWVISMLEKSSGVTFPLWGKVLAVVLSIRPIQGDLMHGNVNLFILFLVVAALYAFCQRWDFLGGLALALAIACKVTPALFLPYFIWKRAWTMVAATVVGLVLFLWIVPSFFLGWQQNQEALKSWFDNMVVPYAVRGEVTPEHNNQSLPGLTARMLTHAPSFSTYIDRIHYTPVEYHNIAELDPNLVRWGLKGCIAFFGLLILWSCRTPGEERTSWRLWAEFSIIALGMLLFSERTWKHHCVVMLLPFAVLSYVLSTRWHEAGLRWFVIGCLALASLLMLSTSTGLFGKHDQFGKLAQVYGAYVWAYLVLIVGLVVVLRRRELDTTPSYL